MSWVFTVQLNPVLDTGISRMSGIIREFISAVNLKKNAVSVANFEDVAVFLAFFFKSV